MGGGSFCICIDYVAFGNRKRRVFRAQAVDRLVDLFSDDVRLIGIAEQVQASLFRRYTCFPCRPENRFSRRIQDEPKALPAFRERGVGSVQLAVFLPGVRNRLASAQFKYQTRKTVARTTPQVGIALGSSRRIHCGSDPDKIARPSV